MIRLFVVAFALALAATAPARAQDCGDFPLPPCVTCGDFPLPPCDDPICGIPGTPPCFPTCGTEDTPLCPTCGTPTTPPCVDPDPTCGVPGLPDCPPACETPNADGTCCGQPGHPICETPPTCGIEGTPPCLVCGQDNLPACPCDVPGTPACLSPPVARCGEAGLPACVSLCLESLTVPACSASGTGLCVAHRWRFDELTGTTVSDSVGTAHGSLSPHAERTAGLDGNALLLPSRQARTALLTDPFPAFRTADFSLSLWVRSALDNVQSTIVELGDVRLGLETGHLTVFFGAFTHRSALPLSHSRWNHVALVRSGTTHQLFVNGYATDVLTSPAVLDLIGGDQRKFGPFKGVLEDVRVYDGALSPEQVRLEATGLCASPVE